MEEDCAEHTCFSVAEHITSCVHVIIMLSTVMCGSYLLMCRTANGKSLSNTDTEHNDLVRL